MTFNDDECYRLFLATSAYIEQYEPATYGELDNLDKMKTINQRLKDDYNRIRRKHGNSEI